MSKVARGQALTDVMLEIRNYASVPAHLEGSVVTHAARSSIPTFRRLHRVAILDCVDISNSRATHR